MSEQTVFVKVAGNPTGEDMAALNEALNEALPEEWGVVLFTDEIEAMDATEAISQLRNVADELEKDHRLAGAEPAEQPGPVDEDGDGIIPTEDTHE